MKLRKTNETMEVMDFEKWAEDYHPNGEETADVRILCEEAAENLLKAINSGEYMPGTKEYDGLIRALSEVNKVRSDAFKIEADQFDKEQKFKDEKKRWKVDTALRIAQIMSSVGLTLLGFMGTFNYEKEHSISTKVFNWTLKLIPKIGR